MAKCGLYLKRTYWTLLRPLSVLIEARYTSSMKGNLTNPLYTKDKEVENQNILAHLTFTVKFKSIKRASI